ncbi:amidohydrolase family protein [Williamsia sp. D3]|uniref:amidohydrolase family protein n=1 Tax=Williamsia sp. D3 TaxID=1313067 RepID=UPI0003D3161E|nr:amidohydrolase family protein [Williamsia sp. D3]ETD33279.1 amidohydrolase [Williamsia sp. D3]
MLIIGAHAITGKPLTVRTDAALITEVDDHLTPRPGEEVIDIAGGTVIPALHDHHLHLRAAIAAATSLQVGPPKVNDRDALARVLRAATPGADGWIRAVGYHDSVAGHLDRYQLDALLPSVPLRVQHRSGALWIINSAGLAALKRPDHPTGRLFRQDTDVAAALVSTPVDFGLISAQLTSYGVAGVTEATPDLTAAELDAFDQARRSGRLRQRVLVLSADSGHDTLQFGPRKRILDDDTLDLDALIHWITDVHAGRTPVAMHCVTVAQLVVAVAALRTAGPTKGDRIEHAAMVPDDMISELVDLGVTVVTQPNFIAERAEQYLQDIPAADLPQLWRLASLQGAGVAVAGSTDAPFGDLDPWACMRAARDRATISGTTLGPTERVPARTALELFLGEPHSPATLRTLSPGARADITMLSASPDVVLAELTAELVCATMIGGIVYQRS